MSVDIEAAEIGLPDGFSGAAIRPGDPEYDATRAVYNGMIDRRPALIVRPTGAADIRDAVAFARQQKLPLAVRCGGHRSAASALSRAVCRSTCAASRASTSTPSAAPRSPTRGCSGASTTGRPRCTASPPPAAGSPRPASAGSASVAATAGSPPSSGSRATTWSARSCSPRAASCSTSPRTPTPSSSGRSAGRAPTSAS